MVKLIHHVLNRVHVCIGHFRLHYLSVHLRICVDIADADLGQSDGLRRFLLEGFLRLFVHEKECKEMLIEYLDLGHQQYFR